MIITKKKNSTMKLIEWHDMIDNKEKMMKIFYISQL